MDKQIIEWIGKHIAAILLVLSVFIQISPIKINPWSSLLKWIGTTLNSSLDTRLSELEKKVEEVSENIDDNEKDRIRWEVLDFARECREGRLHTKDEYHHIIVLNDKYLKLLQRTGDTNGVFEAEYEYIKKLYQEKNEKDDFLRP